MLRSMSAAMLALLLTACATSHVLVGRLRPPIDPAQVRVYFEPPRRAFEEVALLSTSSGPFTYGDQNQIDAVLWNLRQEAAKLGANGVLFRGATDRRGNTGVRVGVGGGSFGHGSFGFGGIGVGISPGKKSARGIAIYVPTPPPPD